MSDVKKVVPFVYWADCEDPDQSSMCWHREDALTQVNDHGGTVHELSHTKDLAAAQSELAALREGLADKHEELSAVLGREALVEQRLTAAEQRNAASNTEIVAMVESALRRSFSLGQVYWQQADSDSTCQQNKSDQTMEVQAQHILNVVKSINELTKTTESGASE
jgi:predicted  nucleic acid-binding Zn-ribbon protein